MASFSVNFYSLNGKSGLLGEWFEKEEEREREREREREGGGEIIVVTPSSHRHENLAKGGNFGKRPARTQNVANTEGQNSFSFFAWP